MFQDIEVSKQVNQLFKESKFGGDSVEFNVQVLTAAHWNSLEPFSIILPSEVLSFFIFYSKISNYQEMFEEFYKGIHKGRTLSWGHSLGTCSLTSIFESGTKEILLSESQAVILLLFNTRDKLTFDDIKHSTGLENVELCRMLQTIVHGKHKV